MRHLHLMKTKFRPEILGLMLQLSLLQHQVAGEAMSSNKIAHSPPHPLLTLGLPQPLINNHLPLIHGVPQNRQMKPLPSSLKMNGMPSLTHNPKIIKLSPQL